MKNSIDITALHNWFIDSRRAFPWRENPTPYRVWISEVMLQQTRASVVIPYFQRWMELFPDLPKLADATLEEVIKAWEGLGYYSRARHLHEASRQIMKHHGGKIPTQREELEKIRGLGPYMVNAVLSFAFHQKVAPVDGNVARVLARHFLVLENIYHQMTKKHLQTLADQILDHKRPWITAEALIELGATLCLRKPLCSFCPINQTCKALQENQAEDLPIKSRDVPITVLSRAVAVIEEKDALLLKKGEPGQVMADLYEFPYFEGLDGPLSRHINSKWGLITTFVRSLPFVQHSYTRYRAHLFPIHLRALNRIEIENYEWVSLERIRELPFSSGHRKILEYFIKRTDPQLTLF